MNEPETNSKVLGEQVLAIAKTICRDCIFRGRLLSLVEMPNGGNEYCQLQKLNKDKARFNREDGYWSLDYFCNSCRNQDWLKYNKLLGATEEEIKLVIRKENTVKSDIIFLFHQNHLIQDIERVLDKVESKYVSNVLISINNPDLRPSHLSKLMNRYTFPWQISFNLESICTEMQVAKIHKYSKGMFSIIVDRMTLFDSKLPEELDTRINDKNEKFVLYQPEEGISNLVIHNMMYGMLKTIDVNIIKQFAEGQKCQHMLKLKTQ
jgi:hypothetical protein